MNLKNTQDRKVDNMRTPEEIRLRTALEAAHKALEDASEEISHWGGYASEYFQDKWHLTDKIKTTQDATKAAKDALDYVEPPK